MPSNSTLEMQDKSSWQSAMQQWVESADLPLSEKVSKKELPCVETLTLYDAANLHRLVWPTTEAAEIAKRYLSPFVINGTKLYIDNLDAEMRLLQIEQHVIPILIVNNTYDNAYVCSPYAHYISLALDSLQVIKNSFVRKMVEQALNVCGKLLRKAKINQIIYVNHWLLSTDLYPEGITEKNVTQITDFLKQHFPTHTIAFRSINEKTNKELKTHLTENNYHFVASRQIYITNPQDPALFQTRIVKSDLKLWNERDFEVLNHHELTDKDIERILKLYTSVSVEHHSHLNPQLNKNFIRLMIEKRILNLKALKKNSTLEGVVGFFEHKKIFMAPFFGYDKKHPDKNRIYRLLSTMLLVEASGSKTDFHQGAGASFYKKIRRALPYQEYIAVNNTHLPISRRFAWGALKFIMNTAGILFMKKY